MNISLKKAELSKKTATHDWVAFLFFIIHIAHRVSQDAPEKSHHECHVEDDGFFEQAVPAIGNQCRKQFGKHAKMRQLTAKKQMLANI